MSKKIRVNKAEKNHPSEKRELETADLCDWLDIRRSQSGWIDLNFFPPKRPAI